MAPGAPPVWVTAPATVSGEMTEHSAPSPWARPDSEVTLPSPAPAYPAPGPAAPAVPPEQGREQPAGSRTTVYFGLGAVALLAAGLVVVLVMAFSGTFSGPSSGAGPFGGAEPDESAPPLAKLCPPPTAHKNPEYVEPEPPPPGERTVDRDAGISYAAYGDPWEKWRADWSGGDLKVHYRVGQHFVTETYTGGDYHASILSGSVPATVNDGTALDLKCTGRQVTADVRRSYYPDGNRLKTVRDEAATLGGRPAWVSVFRLHFDEPGLKAKSELVAVALIDVGRTEAAVLYVSIPDTHKKFDHVVDDVIDSVRPVE